MFVIVPTTSGAVTRISNNQEWEPEKEQNKEFFLRSVLCDHAVGRKAPQKKMNNHLGDMNVDNEKITSVCDGLLRDYQLRDEAITNLTRLVKEAVDHPASYRPRQDTTGPHSMVPSDLIDAGRGHWNNMETFLHGVKVVGPHVAGPPLRSQAATSTPYMPVREHAPCHMSSPTQPLCVEIPDRHVHRTVHDNRQGYRSAAPIQRFNNKPRNWPA